MLVKCNKCGVQDDMDPRDFKAGCRCDLCNGTVSPDYTRKINKERPTRSTKKGETNGKK